MKEKNSKKNKKEVWKEILEIEKSVFERKVVLKENLFLWIILISPLYDLLDSITVSYGHLPVLSLAAFNRDFFGAAVVQVSKPV